MTVLITVFHFLLLAFLEPSEIILDQEGGVELADSDLVVA